MNVVAFDVGTTSCKAAAFDSRGGMIASASSGYPTSFPAPLSAEQHPDAWWKAVCESSRRVLERVGAENVGCVSLSGIMTGLVLVDARGKAVAPSIIHADVRAGKECGRIGRAIGDDGFYRLTGQRLDPRAGVFKLAWAARHWKDAFRKAAFAFQAKDYVRMRLTGNAATDFSDASHAGLLDIARGEWADDLVREAGGKGLMPPLLPSVAPAGKVARGAASETGLLEGTPVAVGAGDGAATTRGVGMPHLGGSYVYLGSTSYSGRLLSRYRPDPRRRLFYVLDFDGRELGAYGTVQNAGAAFDWGAALLGCEGAAGLEELALSSPAGAKGLVFLPYLSGERTPVWDASARGAFVGLTPRHARGELARAVLEGVAQAVSEAHSCLDARGRILVAGGGAGGKLFLSILAASLRRKLVIAAPRDATTLGAAMAGMVACGLQPDPGKAARLARTGVEVAPPKDLTAVARRLRPVFRESYERLKDLFPRLEDGERSGG